MLKEKKLYMCFVDLEEAFHRVPRKVRVDSELSWELVVKVGMHQGSVVLPFLYALVVDVVTDFTREGVLSPDE